jgi:hypothetical protein
MIPAQEDHADEMDVSHHSCIDGRRIVPSRRHRRTGEWTLKDRHQLRQFSCRGIEAAQAEAELATATANLLKIWRSRS